ncbi:MAG: hypothetical protein Q8Q85_01335 [Gemmatimonadales bacterium]|nr:hypothetical protein [Gemmatimonadales bacterium]
MKRGEDSVRFVRAGSTVWIAVEGGVCQQVVSEDGFEVHAREGVGVWLPVSAMRAALVNGDTRRLLRGLKGGAVKRAHGEDA